VEDGFELFPEPVMNVNDGVAETAQVHLEDEPYLFSLGLLDLSGKFGPRSELFSRALNLNFDRDADDDDAYQLLKEIIDGDGGAFVDLEREPGVEGVELLALTADAYTVSFDNDEVVDVLTVEGPDVEGVLGDLNAPANPADGANHLSLVNTLPQSMLEAVLKAALDRSDNRATLLGVENDNFAARVDNATTGEFDLFVFFGGAAEDAIDATMAGTVDPSNSVSELLIADVTGSADVATGSDLDVYFGGPGLPSVGATVDETELLGILATADQRPGVDAIDQGGTVRLEIPGEDGTRDVIVFQTTQGPPGGASSRNPTP
jgi:hypothetical protein